MKMMKFDEKYAHFNYYQWNSYFFLKNLHLMQVYKLKVEQDPKNKSGSRTITTTIAIVRVSHHKYYQ